MIRTLNPSVQHSVLMLHQSIQVVIQGLSAEANNLVGRLCKQQGASASQVDIIQQRSTIHEGKQRNRKYRHTFAMDRIAHLTSKLTSWA
eukprot:scaffold1967_cov199-Alexandrium_tamarense.AAC.16